MQKSGSTGVDRYVLSVRKDLAAGKFHKKELNQMSPLGGAVAGYYSGTQLRLIKTTYGGESGFHAYDFYIRHDSLVFVDESALMVKMPEDPKQLEAYVKTHTDKNGNLDLSKLPKEEDEHNVYYIADNTIIDFRLKSFGKIRQATEDEISSKNKEILEHYNTHLKELKE